jgi:N-acetylmuramic acid 6-phosphate etherase
MSDASHNRSEEFLKISSQFQLGALTTEASHPVTAHLSEVAKQDVSGALALLFEVDRDVLSKYREFVQSGRALQLQQTVGTALQNGGRLFFTGCGSTGRLSLQLVSIWREFWQQQRARGLRCSPTAEEWENRAFAVMAGGDFALMKAVEGFEDFTAFGQKQLGGFGVSNRDVVFAITEGGETSFVIGTAWKGVEVGAKVYFVYNNPDEVLCQHVQRSREVLQERRIEKINLTTGPMAITGSTRMQATTIQLAVLVTVLEMVVRDLLRMLEPGGPGALESQTVPSTFLQYFEQLLATLQSSQVFSQLSHLVTLEEATYRTGHITNYYADRFGIDMLTDTTERSPTYCTPPFRKFDDPFAAESWAFLFVQQDQTRTAWRHILKHEPNCLQWSEEEVRSLVGEEKAAKVCEIIRRISSEELMRFRVGLDGLKYRVLKPGDLGVGLLCEREKSSLLAPDGFYRTQLENARANGAKNGLIYLGSGSSCAEIGEFMARRNPDCPAVLVAVPNTGLLLDGVTRVGVKVLLNALSTCTMVRLGRVMGNFMIWVVPSNLKLIDRATRYIEKLTGLDYRQSNGLLFEVIEYVEPRMKADQAYPPVVGLAVTRMRHGLDNAQAEQRLAADAAA